MVALSIRGKEGEGAGLADPNPVRTPPPPQPRALAQAGEPAKLRPFLRLDEHNNAVWIRIPRGGAAAELVEELGLWHPKDRNGKVRLSGSARCMAHFREKAHDACWDAACSGRRAKGS